MNTYVVTFGTYELGVVCAFSTEEGAQHYVEQMNARLKPTDIPSYCYQYEVLELDPPVPDPEPLLPEPEPIKRSLEERVPKLEQWREDERRKRREACTCIAVEGGGFGTACPLHGPRLRS